MEGIGRIRAENRHHAPQPGWWLDSDSTRRWNLDSEKVFAPSAESSGVVLEGNLDISAQTLLDEISHLFSGIRPGEFTMMDYAEREGLTRGQVQYRLKKLVEEGVLERRFAHIGGKRVVAFRGSTGTKSGRADAPD